MGSVSLSPPDCPKCGSCYIETVYVYNGNGVEPDERSYICLNCGEEFDN
ncbi:hypothetical protein [Cetobacterium sp.]